MQGISLKDFQIKTGNKLLDYTTVGDRKEVLLQAPTGSGKTIILLSYIEEYLEENKNTVFVWLTPGRGDLEEQSNKKMRKFLPNHSTKFIQEVLLQGFDAKDTAFINWETITKKGNNALKGTERKNLFERIHEAHNKGLKFIAIVDEEHVNKTIKAEAIIEYLEPEYIVRVSATTKTNKEASFIEVNELDVISEGLITRALYINEGVSNQDILTNEHEYLIDLALNKRKNIRNEYIKKELRINPLIIIQVPNKSDDLIKQIEKILESKEYTYNHGNLAIWLSDRKENIEDIDANFAQPVILIMKQAISTGWDCPRAKILVKLRENMSEDFETQTLGRIRRMPEAHHYDNVLLDNCYLYTFDDIEANFAQPAVLIMKQAISTGCDCPRAKILVKLRENMSEDFETQTLGRIRRMPEAHHYDNVLLDNCYLYTFDEKYEETVRQELGNNASDSKVIFLKNQYKDFSLIKEIANSEFDGFDDRETFRILHQYFIDKYNLTTNKKNNQVILESHGYKFKDTIESNIVQDKIIKLHSSELESANRIKVESSVTTSKNGFELRYSIGMISSRIGIRYDRTRLMLERMFLKSKLFTKKFVNLSIIEFYAFVINNESLLKHDFHEAVSQKARQQKMDLEEVKTVKWSFPQQNYIKYDKTMKDTEIYNKNVYIEYPSSTIKSTSERLFEHFCENNENIKWFYKNGDKAAEYFSIVYVDAINKRWHFYPDYILCDHKNNIWIIETKGGESISGQSKNIDIKVENKFEALKKYATEHNINFGIVRDYDKNGWLYLCNTEYTDDMGNDNWVLLKDIFND